MGSAARFNLALFPYDLGPHVEPFDFFASVSIAAGVTAVVASGQIPNQVKDGFIVLFGQGIDDASKWPTTTWRIRVNNVPTKDYGNVIDQLADFTDPKEINAIRVRPGDIVDVQVTNGAATTGLFAARLRGLNAYGG